MKRTLKKCDSIKALDIKTRVLIRNHPLNLPQLARALEVPYVWLKKYASGAISGANVNRVQHVYEKLTGTKLNVEI